jgi:imidazoleglycerol phosphate synthase glutamine amidotransferase subunit HisH
LPGAVIQTGRMAREVTLVDAGLGNIASVERALVQVGAAVRVTGDPDLVARARMVVFPGQSAFGAATRAIVEGSMGDALKMVIERGDPFLGICLGMQLLLDGSDENASQEGLHVIPGWCRRFPDGMVVEAEPGASETETEPAAAVADPEIAQTVAEPIPGDSSPYAVGHGELAAAADTGGGSLSGAVPMTIVPPLAAVPDEPTGMPASAPTGFEPAPEDIFEEEEPTIVAARVAPEALMRRLKVPHMGWNSVEPTGEHYYFVHSYYAECGRSEDVMWMTTYGGIRFPAAIRRNNVLGCQFHPEKSQRAGLKFLRAFLLGGWG